MGDTDKPSVNELVHTGYKTYAGNHKTKLEYTTQTPMTMQPHHFGHQYHHFGCLPLPHGYQQI